MKFGKFPFRVSAHGIFLKFGIFSGKIFPLISAKIDIMGFFGSLLRISAPLQKNFFRVCCGLFSGKTFSPISNKNRFSQQNPGLGPKGELLGTGVEKFEISNPKKNRYIEFSRDRLKIFPARIPHFRGNQEPKWEFSEFHAPRFQLLYQTDKY